jgi:hypothetical protein
VKGKYKEGNRKEIKLKEKGVLLDTNKADKANPTFTGTATFNTITTQSLTDNGNITIKGNTIIGDASGDTLVVTGLSTFSISSLPYSGVII